MQLQERRLGKGLSALLGESKSKPEENESGSVKLIPFNKIISGTYQPRKNFDSAELSELAISIKESGLIQPITLRKIRDDHYEIVAGERRFRAARIAGLDKIPSIIRKLTNKETLEIAIVENIQRSDLSAIEEAVGYKRLLEEFYYTHEDISKRTGKSRSHITNVLRLLLLPETVHKLMDKKLISMGHARALINSSSPEKLAKKVADESLSVRDVEDLVRHEKSEKQKSSPAKNSQKKTSSATRSELTNLRDEISKLLKTDVKIIYSHTNQSGKIVVNFSGLDQAKKIAKKFRNS